MPATVGASPILLKTGHSLSALSATLMKALQQTEMAGTINWRDAPGFRESGVIWLFENITM